MSRGRTAVKALTRLSLPADDHRGRDRLRRRSAIALPRRWITRWGEL